jgi:acetoacetyl-CoA synthetase
MPLFITLSGGRQLDDALRQKIRDRLRQEYTPRHVPDRIIQVREIPATLTGKKMEVPVRRILLGMPREGAANANAMRNPGSLDEFASYASSQQDYSLSPPQGS